MSRPVALVVGAGVGGLSAAIALARAGCDVRVFERAPEVRALGFALNLAANAVRALRELGVARPVLDGGARTRISEIRRLDGRVLRRLDVAAAIAEVQAVMTLRPVLHGALIGALDPACLSLGAAAERFVVDGRRVILTLADGRSVSGDLLVGADGVDSVVRRALHPDEPRPVPSRWMAIRGVVQARHELGDCDAIAWLGPGLESAAVRADDETVYWFMSLLRSDLPADRPSAGQVARARAAGADAVLQRLVAATADTDVRIDDLFIREPLAQWGRGPVTLLGDAAHPVLPHTGQGAALALEDAVALGLALTDATDISLALRRYEHVRAARTRAFVRLGPRIARVTTTRNRAIAAIRSTAIRHAPARAMLSAFFQAAEEDVHRELR